ncbi:DNA ligase [Xanthomonas phage XaC1]|nr:DNA ligase [Xanthomonas phage XaC1]
MEVYDILKLLKATTKTNEKKKILESNKDNELLKKTIRLALHPQLQSGIKKVPQEAFFERNDFPSLTLNEALDTMQEFYDSKITGNAARQKLYDMLVSLSKEDALVLERVVMKDLDCGVQESTANAVLGKNFIPEQPYMRCSLVTEKTIKNITSLTDPVYNYTAVSEVKMDGQYLDHVIRENTYVSTSRNGKVYDFLGTKDAEAYALAAELKRLDPVFDTGVALNGEALATDKSGTIHKRETSNGIVQKAGKDSISDEEAESVIFVVWDVLPYDKFVDGEWKKERKYRREILEKAINNLNLKYFRMVEYKVVNSIDEAFDYNEEVINRGEEGTILKCESAIWKFHTSPKQLKMKLEMDIDLIITGFNYGESDGKFSNTIGSIKAESADGLIKVNVSGFKEKDDEWTRDEILRRWNEIEDTIMTVTTTELTRDKRTGQRSIFLPRYKEFRFDKDTADTYERILEIRKSAIKVLKEKLKRK